MAERKETYIGNSKLKGSPEKPLKVILGEQVVKSKNIADGAVISSKLNDDAVTSDKIFNGSVTQNKIADKAVTLNKIADEVKDYINNAGSGGAYDDAVTFRKGINYKEEGKGYNKLRIKDGSGSNIGYIGTDNGTKVNIKSDKDISIKAEGGDLAILSTSRASIKGTKVKIYDNSNTGIDIDGTIAIKQDGENVFEADNVKTKIRDIEGCNNISLFTTLGGYMQLYQEDGKFILMRKGANDVDITSKIVGIRYENSLPTANVELANTLYIAGGNVYILDRDTDTPNWINLTPFNALTFTSPQWFSIRPGETAAFEFPYAKNVQVLCKIVSVSGISPDDSDDLDFSMYVRGNTYSSGCSVNIPGYLLVDDLFTNLPNPPIHGIGSLYIKSNADSETSEGKTVQGWVMPMYLQ